MAAKKKHDVPQKLLDLAHDYDQRGPEAAPRMREMVERWFELGCNQKGVMAKTHPEIFEPFVDWYNEQRDGKPATMTYIRNRLEGFAQHAGRIQPHVRYDNLRMRAKRSDRKKPTPSPAADRGSTAARQSAEGDRPEGVGEIDLEDVDIEAFIVAWAEADTLADMQVTWSAAVGRDVDYDELRALRLAINERLCEHGAELPELHAHDYEALADLVKKKFGS